MPDARLPRELREILYDELVDTLRDETVPAIQRITPVLTGLLRRSWEAERTKTGARAINRTRYAGFVNRGRYRREVEDLFERSVRRDVVPAIQRAVDRWCRTREAERYFARLLLGDLPRTIQIKL